MKKEMIAVMPPPEYVERDGYYGLLHRKTGAYYWTEWHAKHQLWETGSGTFRRPEEMAERGWEYMEPSPELVIAHQDTQIEKLTRLLRRIVRGSCEYDEWLNSDAWAAISEVKKEIGE